MGRRAPARDRRPTREMPRNGGPLDQLCCKGPSHPVSPGVAAGDTPRAGYSRKASRLHGEQRRGQGRGVHVHTTWAGQPEQDEDEDETRMRMRTRMRNRSRIRMRMSIRSRMRRRRKRSMA